MRSKTGPSAGGTRRARHMSTSRGRWIGALAGTVLAATALAVFSPAPDRAFAGTDPGGPLIYVSNIAENSAVTAYSLNTGAALATLPTTGVAEALAFSPDGSTVYAAESGDYVGVINVATNTVIANIPVGFWPTSLAMSPDGSTVYVTDAQSNTISVINASTYTVTATIPAGASPQSVVISPDGATLYVAGSGDVSNDEAGTITMISTATDGITGTISMGAYAGAAAVALSPDGTTAYVANADSNAVSVIDLTTDAVTATIPVGLFPDSLTVTPDGRSVYIANSSSESISVIDTATDAVTATIPIAGGPVQVANYPDGGSVFATTGDGVSVISTENNTVTGTLTNTPDAIALAISPNPAVTSVSPNGGAPAGGGQVTLTGVGFEYVLGVSFSGASATSYTVTSSTTITATVPPGNPGPVYAFVTTIRGSSEATSSAQYTYQSVPTITGVSPADGLVGGGGVSTITGTGLSGPAMVMYGTKPGKILSQSPTEMRVSAPPGTAGTTVDITVTNTMGTSAISSADEYRYFQLVHIPTPPIRHPIL
jgi:YVTN family beta-propeller protein